MILKQSQPVSDILMGRMTLNLQRKGITPVFIASSNILLDCVLDTEDINWTRLGRKFSSNKAKPKGDGSYIFPILLKNYA